MAYLFLSWELAIDGNAPIQNSSVKEVVIVNITTCLYCFISSNPCRKPYPKYILFSMLIVFGMDLLEYKIK